MEIDLVVDRYEGGYRPTASGKVGGRSFYFRWMGDSWSFGVSTDAASGEDFWWHSPPDALTFEEHGTGQPVWHTNSLPIFLQALRRYLDSQGIPPDEQSAIEGVARRDAEAIFARSVP